MNENYFETNNHIKFGICDERFRIILVITKSLIRPLLRIISLDLNLKIMFCGRKICIQIRL